MLSERTEVVNSIDRIGNRIIDKHEGHFSIISNDKTNEYLKEVARLAKFNDKVEIIYTKGGKREREVLKKWELVTVHTARRSFATNAYLMSVPTISIMKIAGHRTEKAFCKHQGFKEDKTNKLINDPFFY